MIGVLRIVFGLLFGLGAIFFLFVAVVGLRRGRDGAGVALGIAAIGGAIALYLLSPRQAEPAKRRKRSVAPPAIEAEERPVRHQPPAEGFARYFDARTWDFDLAKVTPAGWVFGLTSVLGMAAGFGLLAGLGRLDLPRWAIKWFGPVLLAPVTAYFIFGAKLLKRWGHPVFREKPASREPGRKAAGGVPTSPGLPPRRRSGPA